MARKDACAAVPRWKRWKTRLFWVIGGSAILAACGAARYYWGPHDAKALGIPGPATATQRNTAGSGQSPAGSSARVPSRSTADLKIVAAVNSEQISRQDLAREAARRFGEKVLESLVNKQLILEACAAQKIAISEKDVEDEIERMAGKWGLSTERWLGVLQSKRNINPDQYRRDIIWPTIALRRLAAEKLIVSQADVDKAWESMYGPKVQVRLISTTSRDRAGQLHARAVANPAEFDKLAKDYSEDSASAAARGLIPPIRRHIGEPEVERVAFALTEGQISPIIHVANQYLILKCERHLDATPIDAKHVQWAREQIRDRIRDKKLRGAATDIFKQLQEQASVVNIYNNPQQLARLPGIAATVNGRQITMRQLSEECITRHGTEVLDGEINRKLLTQALKAANATVTERDLDVEIARAAETYGYLKKDGSPDVHAWLAKVVKDEDATVELYVRDAVWPSVALKKLVAARVEITEEDIDKAYEANYGARVEALVIVLDNHRRAQEVWEMARSDSTDEHFGKLAQEYSIEPISKANFGKVPPIRRYSGQPLIEARGVFAQGGRAFGRARSGRQVRHSPMPGTLAAGSPRVGGRFPGVVQRHPREEASHRDDQRVRPAQGVLADRQLPGRHKPFAHPVARPNRPASDRGGPHGAVCRAAAKVAGPHCSQGVAFRLMQSDQSSPVLCQALMLG